MFFVLYAHRLQLHVAEQYKAKWTWAEFEKVAMDLKIWTLSVENSKPTRRYGTRSQKRGVGCAVIG